MAKGEVETLEKDADVAEKKGAAADQPEAPDQPAGAEQAGAAEQPQLDEKTRAALADMRGRIQLKVGQVMLAMMNLARYRDQNLGDMRHLVVEPLMRDRIAIATAKTENEDEKDGTLAGIAIWASVSHEVDAKIREQIKAGVFPTRLKPEDWSSGDKVWLLDVIAPTRELTRAVLANFAKTTKGKQLQIHPLLAKVIDQKRAGEIRASDQPSGPE